MLRPRPANDLADNSRLTLARFDAGRDTDVDKWSLEYAEVHGPLSWQGEYSGAVLDDGAQQAKVQAAYGFVSWFVTGESRGYDRKTGRFSRVKAMRHRTGALELALRYDRMWGRQHPDGMADTIDASMRAVALGANWYFQPNLRVMFDVIDSRNRDHRTGTRLDHTLAYTGRVQDRRTAGAAFNP